MDGRQEYIEGPLRALAEQVPELLMKGALYAGIVVVVFATLCGGLAFLSRFGNHQ
ncbi:MAG: hypothetical protein KBC16_02630 [Candidatus Pacebacteria bacterium]|nr:hypothetical protein [Candidatus Paceibacterota bacterium]